MTYQEQVERLLNIVADWGNNEQTRCAFRLIELVAADNVAHLLETNAPSRPTQLWCAVHDLAHAVQCPQMPYLDRDKLVEAIREALHELLDYYKGR